MAATERMLWILGLFGLDMPVITPEWLMGELGVSRASIYRAAVVNGQMPALQLDSDETERKPHAWSFIQMAVRIGTFMQPKLRLAAMLTRGALRVASLCRPVRDYVLQLKFKPKPRFFAGAEAANALVAAVQLLPQPMVELQGGAHVKRDDMLGAGFALLTLPSSRAAGVLDDFRAAGLYCQHLAVVDQSEDFLPQAIARVEVAAAPDAVVQECSGTLGKIIRSAGADAVWLRPDRYVLAYVDNHSRRAKYACSACWRNMPPPSQHFPPEFFTTKDNMKIISFTHQAKASWGVVNGTSVTPLQSAEYPTLLSALQAGKLQEIAAAASGTAIGLTDIKFLPVIPAPGKIFCVGHNYEAHRIETQRDKTQHPLLFMRVGESQVGHDQPILLPAESTNLDYEGEIAIVIGKAGRRIAEADAWSYVAGYSAYNEGSVRDWQKHTIQFTAGKNFTATGAFGPWMVTRDEIVDGEELTLETRLNGEVMQHTTTASMIFSIPVLIEYISTFTSLQPGDVIVTGTPGGVGAKRVPPVWMKPGDKVEIEVSKVGVLVNSIAADSTRY